MHSFYSLTLVMLRCPAPVRASRAGRAKNSTNHGFGRAAGLLSLTSARGREARTLYSSSLDCHLSAQLDHAVGRQMIEPRR
jgi:hypothetical protein